MWLRSKGSLQAHDQQYGSWLRASPEKLQHPQRVHVQAGEKGKTSNHSTRSMVTTTMKDGGEDQTAAVGTVVMEVEHMVNIKGTDHSKTETTITPKNQWNSVIVVNDKKFEKELAATDTELGRNVIIAADISESQIKATNTETIDGCFEIESGKVDERVNLATDIISAVDPGLNEKVVLSSAITPPQVETCEGVEMGSFKLGPSNNNLAQTSSAARKPKTRNNTSITALK